MHYILHLSALHFYSFVFTEIHSALRGAPFVVEEAKRVLDASPEALARGVRLGMRIAEARTLVKDCAIVERSEEALRPYKEAWLDVCAEFADVIEPESDDRAYLDLSAQPDPYLTARELRLALHDRTSMAFRGGMSSAKWLSRVVCEVAGHRFGSAEWVEECKTATLAPRDFVASLPVSLLTPLAPSTRERLRFLGYRTAGQVADLPQEVLREQFGEEAPLIRLCALGKGSAPVRALYPPRSVFARVSFDSPVEAEGGLLDAVRDLAEELGRKLTDSEQQGQRLNLRIEVESGAPEVRKRSFAKPLRDARSVECALQAILRERPQAPFVAMSARLPALQPARRTQSDFRYLSIPSERREVEPALHTIREQYGAKSVVHASDLSFPRRVKLLKLWRDATGWN